jgi:hypothetical protein
MPGTIILFVSARAFMFTNYIRVILINGTASDYSNLFMFAHD